MEGNRFISALGSYNSTLTIHTRQSCAVSVLFNPSPKTTYVLRGEGRHGKQSLENSGIQCVGPSVIWIVDFKKWIHEFWQFQAKWLMWNQPLFLWDILNWCLESAMDCTSNINLNPDKMKMWLASPWSQQDGGTVLERFTLRGTLDETWWLHV